MKDIKLKACPFCGKQPAVFPSGDGTGEMVECQNPGCINPHVSYYGKNVARQKWNDRAGDREPEAAQSEAAKADSLKRVVKPQEAIYTIQFRWNGPPLKKWKKIKTPTVITLGAKPTLKEEIAALKKSVA